MGIRTFGQRGAGGQSPISIEYVTKPGLVQIALLNLVLNLITLFFYRFWAKTNVRRHIWSCVHINGEPLEYTGRGSELFLGFLIVFGVVILPFAALVIALQLMPGAEVFIILLQFAFAIFVLVFWGMALYRARRYQLSRTLWRGIRGALVGSSWTYSFLFFAALLLRSITFGWSTPAMNLNLQERMTGDMRFGNVPFHFSGRAGPLYGAYAISWVTSFILIIGLGGLFGFGFIDMWNEAFTTERPGPRTDLDLLSVLLILGGIGLLVLFSIIYAVAWAFYAAREMSIFASYTTFDQARFQFDATAGSLIWLIVSNFLIIVLTLGIATPFAQQRLVRYFCNRLTVHGTVNLNQILQSREAVGRTGEGLAEAFDLGGI